MKSKRQTAIRASQQRGFSLVELIIVIAIILVVAVVAIPNILNGISYVRLHNAGTDAANMIQQARIRSVRDNQYYAVLSGVEPGTGLPIIYVDLNNNGVYDLKEPMATFNTNVTLNPASLSAADLTDLEGDVMAGVANIGNASFQISSGTTTQPPVFNMRGYPCVPAAGAIGTAPALITACNTLVPGPGGGIPYAFIYILNTTQLAADGWMAVTVSPAGRIKTWTYHTGGASHWQ